VEDTVGIDTTLASLLVQVASLEHTCCALDAEHEKAMVIAQRCAWRSTVDAWLFFCRANEDRAEMEHVLDAAICQQQVAYKGALHQQLKCYVVFLNAQILAHIQEFD